MTPFNNVHNNSIHGTSLVPVGVHDGADQKSSDLVDIGVSLSNVASCPSLPNRLLTLSGHIISPSSPKANVTIS
jgi:hypothetical protein